MTFSADRTFHANDRQFVGRWWIASGRLHVKYSGEDWREHWFNPVRLWEVWRGDAANWDIRFVGDRVELAEPGGPPSAALIRAP
jgi:hypothetical protein